MTAPLRAVVVSTLQRDWPSCIAVPAVVPSLTTAHLTHVPLEKVLKGAMEPVAFNTKRVTTEDADRLLETLEARDLQARDIALLCLDCGLGFAEAFALTWGDIDFKKGVAKLADREVALSDRVAEALWSRCAEVYAGRVAFGVDPEQLYRWVDDSFVFPGEDGQRKREMPAVFYAVLEELGLDRRAWEPA